MRALTHTSRAILEGPGLFEKDGIAIPEALGQTDAREIRDERQRNSLIIGHERGLPGHDARLRWPHRKG